jgi:hypothetical protein
MMGGFLLFYSLDVWSGDTIISLRPHTFASNHVQDQDYEA